MSDGKINDEPEPKPECKTPVSPAMASVDSIQKLVLAEDWEALDRLLPIEPDDLEV